MRRRFVLLDRDGTINVDKHYLSDPKQVQLLPAAAAGLRELTRMGLGLIVVTNQSGIGRGYFDESALHGVHQRLQALLRDEEIELDAFYFCPHVPEENCACRKPAPGMVRQAVRDFDFDPQTSFVIGDKSSDIELGRAVGARTLQICTPGTEAPRSGAPDHECRNLQEAAAIIRELLAVEQDPAVNSQVAVSRGAEVFHA